MRSTTKKRINLNKLNTGCAPCLEQAKQMQNKILKKNSSEIKIQEIKKIVSSLFQKD